MFLWLITLLKGFLPIDGKRIGKIIWVLVLCAVAIGAYHKVFIAKSTHQNIVTQIVNNCADDTKVIGLRFNLWKLKFLFGF